MKKFKVVHYINQFFGQIGGEEMATHPPEKRSGPVGPGLGLTAQFKGEAEIVATIICGDGYYNENMDLPPLLLSRWSEKSSLMFSLPDRHLMPGAMVLPVVQSVKPSKMPFRYRF